MSPNVERLKDAVARAAEEIRRLRAGGNDTEDSAAIDHAVTELEAVLNEPQPEPEPPPEPEPQPVPPAAAGRPTQRPTGTVAPSARRK